MSTATVKLKHGALATVTPDFMITRGITETHSLTLLNADNTALIHASVVTWTFQIAQDFLSRTSILAESTSITFADNVLSGILLDAHTVELKAFMQGKAIQPLYGTLIGLNGSAEVVIAITFRVICTNSVYEPDAEPTPAIISGYYTKAQTDALIANIGANLPAATTLARGTIQLATGAEVTAGTNTAKAVVPATLKTELDKKVTAVDGKALSTNDFTDAYKTKVNADVESVATLPTPAVGILNRAYFLTADDGTSKKGTTWKCVADGESYVMQQIQTDLSSLTDTTGILAGKVDKVTGYGLSKNDFTDAYETRLDASVTYASSLPSAAAALAGRIYILTADNDNKAAGTHWKCVLSGETYVWQQVRTALQTLTGDSVTAYPGQSYEWVVASASVTLNASGFVPGSKAGCFIDITLPTGDQVSGGTGVAIVDALEENKVNHMVLQEVSGGVQLLRWLESEDIPA